MKSVLVGMALALMLSLPPVARADGGAGEEMASASPEYRSAVEAIKAGRFADAIRLLDTVVARAPKGADAHNWLGYAHRKSGHLAQAFTHYRRALVIDPRHKGVHEYIGEAYLMEGNVAQAEAHLKKLGEICTSGCEEYDDLKQAIAAYRAGPAAKAPAN